MTNTQMEILFEGFEHEIDAAIAARNRPKGGQSCGPFHGDFAGALPSVLNHLGRWLRSFRASHAEEKAAARIEGYRAGLEGAAKLMCGECASGTAATKALDWKGALRWLHLDEKSYCKASEIHDVTADLERP
jgi:hypothetical protein